MNILLSIIYFVIVLGVLVLIHEFGHFLMARLSGMRVEAFALGMGYRLFGWNKVNGFSIGKLDENIQLDNHTDYRLCAFPIGGFCKISGMVDESFDADFQNTEVQPWEFRAKNPFKKIITITGGVLFNILLAIIFFAIVIYNNGETAYKTTKIGVVKPNSIASQLGFQAGDKILSINGQIPKHWAELIQILAIDNMGNDLNIKTLRSNDTINIFSDGKELTNDIATNIPLGLEPSGVKTIVTDVLENSLAKSNDIKNNDTIIAVNGAEIFSNADFISKLQTHKGQNVLISIKNKNGINDKEFNLDSSGTIGVQISSVFTGNIEVIKYGFFASIGAGFTQTFETFGIIISSIKQIIIGNLEFKKAIGGPIMIAQQAGQVAKHGFLNLLSFTAMLSVSLALINILPFPGLDGGHLLMIIIETITRREIPISAKLVVQQFGMVVLVGLMLYVIFNDVQKLI